MLSLENNVGKLIEVRLVPPTSMSEFDALDLARKQVISKIQQDRVVVMDLTQAKVLPAELSNRLLQILQGNNPGLSRNGVLLPSGKAVLALQIERILREASNPKRRAFYEASELILWVKETLTPEEEQRLTTFLQQP